MKRKGVLLILIIALFGLADSVYLAQHAISGTPLLCDITNLSGCNIVASSEHAQIFGIPLSAFGVLFYGILSVLALFELVVFDQLLRRALQMFAVAGLLSSLYFVSLQAFVIKAFCIYCLASALFALSIFIIATFLEPMPRFSRIPQES